MITIRGKIFSLSGMMFCLISSLHAQIVPDEVYQRSGFRPYWEAGSRAEFDCVGRMATAGGGTGVWLGGPYVLYVAHGTETWKKGVYAPRVPSDYKFVLVKNGREFVFVGKAWHIPRGAWSIDLDTESSVAKRLDHAWDAMDFCVLELDRVPQIAGVLPASLGYVENPIGIDAYWVGFGARGIASIGSDPQRFGHGGTDKPIRKMAWQNKIDSTMTWGWKLVSTFDRAGLPLEGHQASGSSGGGVFAQLDGVWKLIGLACNGGNNAGNIDHVKVNGSMYGARSRAGTMTKFRKELELGLAGDWAPFESIGTSRLNGQPF